MVQHVSSGTGKNANNKKLITLVVSIVVLAVVLTICGTLWYVKQTEKTKLARKQCEIKVAQVMKASNTWKTLIHNDVFRSLADDSTPEGANLVKILKEKAPSAVACTANSPEELGAQGAQAVAASEWYVSRAKEVRKIAFDILNKDNDYINSLGKDDNQDGGDANTPENQDAKKEKEKQEIKKLTGNVIRKAKLTPGKKQVPSIISTSKDEPSKVENKTGDKKGGVKKDGKGDGKGDGKDGKGDGKGNGKDNKDPKNPQLDPKTLDPAKTPKPGTTNPSTTKPGTANPSTTKPGTANPPAQSNPSTTKPGTTTPPAQSNPSTTKPGTTTPPTTSTPKDGKKSSETGGPKRPDIVVGTDPAKAKKN